MTNEEINTITENYLKRTGQTFQELMGGAITFGFSFILELVIQAEKENKKIVWIDVEGIIDGLDYSLENV